MSAMSIRDRIRAWLGLDDVPSLAMFKAMEQKQRERHDVLFTLLSQINQRMINEHVGAPRDFAVPILDWDTVQAMALAALEREPQKEM